MSSRNSAVALLTAAALGMLGSGGCVFGNDSDPPLLSVDFYWEADRGWDGTCATADVETMDFRVIDDADGSVIQEETDRKCSNGFNLVGAGIGDYTIEVTGYDADHQATWSTSCELSLDRFDRAYRCDVDLTSDPGSSS